MNFAKVLKTSFDKFFQLLNKINSVILFRKSTSITVKFGIEEYAVATFNRRMLAATVDMVILMLICSILAPIIYNAMDFDGMVNVAIKAYPTVVFDKNEFIIKQMLAGNKAIITVYALIQILQGLCIALFCVLFWYKNNGATPGKMLLRCAIVDATTGLPPTLEQSIIRVFGGILSIAPLGIGLLWMIFTKKNQALHDVIAGTIVVVKPKVAKS